MLRIRGREDQEDSPEATFRSILRPMPADDEAGHLLVRKRSETTSSFEAPAWRSYRFEVVYLHEFAMASLRALVSPGIGVSGHWCLRALVSPGIGVSGHWCLTSPAQEVWLAGGERLSTRYLRTDFSLDLATSPLIPSPPAAKPCQYPHFFGRDSMISRSGTRKSSDANMLAISKVSISLSGPPVFRKSSDFRYERCG